MPMNTTRDSRSGQPGSSPRAAMPANQTTWSTISAVDRLRVRPAWPVAQNGQAIPQPAWLDTQTVTRSWYPISTLSTSEPSCSRQRVLRVRPSSQDSSRTAVSRSGSSSPASRSRVAAGMSVIRSGSRTNLPK
jgi:hypothetical protein